MTDYILDAEARLFVYSYENFAMGRALKVSAEAMALVMAFEDANLRHTLAGSHYLDADPATFSVVMEADLHRYRLDAEAGSFSLTSQLITPFLGAEAVGAAEILDRTFDQATSSNDPVGFGGEIHDQLVNQILVRDEVG